MDFSSSEYAVKAKHARSGLIWDDKLSLVRQIYPIETRLSPTRAGSVGQEVDTISLIQPFVLTRSFRLRNLGVGRLSFLDIESIAILSLK